MSASESLTVCVEKIDKLNDDTITLTLTAANGAQLPPYSAGAHVSVFIDDGLIREYSLCGDPADAETYQLGILKDADSRGGSAAMHERIRIGDKIQISSPKNQFQLDESARYSVLIGGGIGITPILAMAYELHRNAQEFDLFYCVTQAEKAAFLPVLEQAPFADRVTLHVDQIEPTNPLKPNSDFPPAATGAHIYVCGPSGFMDWCFDEAKALGYGADRLHKEDFRADVDLTGGGFTVEARGSGVTVQVAEGQRIVEALTAAGIEIEVSCEEGVCGTCLCDVLEGEPDHRDSFLTDEERDSSELIMVCCSRSKSSKLVLDV